MLGAGSGKEVAEVEAEPLPCSKDGVCSVDVDEGGVAASAFLHVPERSRVLSLGGSVRLVDGPGSAVVDAESLFLSMKAAPIELTRTRMPFLVGGAGSVVEAVDNAGDGRGLDGESGTGMLRSGRPNLGSPPEAVCRDVSVMLYEMKTDG